MKNAKVLKFIRLLYFVQSVKKDTVRCSLLVYRIYTSVNFVIKNENYYCEQEFEIAEFISILLPLLIHHNAIIEN